MTIADTSEFYKQCNLTGNPFRSNPTQESDPRADIWAGYEKEKKALVKYLVRSRSDQVGNINFLFLYGDYGTGKSHALLWARHQILEKQKGEFNSVSYYIQTLRQAGKVSFGGAFKSEIINKSSILKDVLSYKQFLEEAVVVYRSHHELTHEVPREKILESMIQSAEHMNFVRGLLKCSSEDDVAKLLIPTGFNDHVAVQVLATVINLFVGDIKPAEENIHFKKGAYLFIDEVDLLATSTVKEARDANEILRHIYDLCPNAFCMILGFTATAAELPILFAEYVLSRLTKQIVLEHMEVDEAKLFVKNILDSERVETGGSKSGYFPFEESAIDGITSQIVSITPRKLVSSMQQILEDSRLNGASPKTKLIDLDFLDEHEILEDILE